METSKTTGEIPVVFRLVDEDGNEMPKPLKKEKIQNYYKLQFDRIGKSGKFKLFILIDDLGNVVPESEQFFELNVVQHSKTGCLPCMSASVASGDH